MRRHLPIFCWTIAAFVAAWIGYAPPHTQASVPKVLPQPLIASSPEAERVPVLVELFTAEGCTACPAAEEMLRGLEEKQPVPGVEIIGVVMNMDAWNAQGFRDPFALRQMTNRLNEYVRLFKLDNLQSPQMIVGGQVQLAAVDPVAVRHEVARAAKNQKAQLLVTFQSASVADVKVDKLPAIAGESEIWMAVTESAASAKAATDPVPHHSGVVRSLVLLGMAEPGGPTTYSMHLRFNPRWRREDLNYVVFVQDRATRRIWAATVVTP